MKSLFNSFQLSGLQMSVCLYVCPSVTETPQPLRIAHIDHQTYWPLSLLTIEPINHWAYWPLSLSTIEPIDHRAYRPLSPSTIKPIDLWFSFTTFKPFSLLWLYWLNIFHCKTTRIKWPVLVMNIFWIESIKQSINLWM